MSLVETELPRKRVVALWDDEHGSKRRVEMERGKTGRGKANGEEKKMQIAKEEGGGGCETGRSDGRMGGLGEPLGRSDLVLDGELDDGHGLLVRIEDLEDGGHDLLLLSTGRHGDGVDYGKIVGTTKGRGEGWGE